MKQFKYLLTFTSLLIIGLMVGLYGCTNPLKVGNGFLEKPPSQSGVTKDSVFSNPELAERFLTHAYTTLPYGPGGVTTASSYDKDQLSWDLLSSLTDINQSFVGGPGAQGEYYQPGGVPYSNRKTKFNYDNGGAWAGIRQAHILLNNIDKVPDMSQATKTDIKGQARMIIALQYTDLFRNFGGVPWVTKVYNNPNHTFKDHPRLPAKAMVDSIVGVINKAIKELPFSRPSTQSGRFTSAGAMGLKCRLLLFAASPLFNSSQPYMQGEAASKKYVWYGGYDPNMWGKAADACKALIDKNQQAGMPYHLAQASTKDFAGYRAAFLHAYYDRDSPEILISTRARYKSPNKPSFNHTYYYGEILNAGGGGTTDNYVKMFPMADGTPIDTTNSGYDPAHPYKNRDPRLYETVLVNGDQYQNRKAQLWIGGKERRTKNTLSTKSGYRMRKFILDGTSAFGTVVQFPYLRLPEIYLSYAEALDEENGGPTAEAYKYVNKVRHRVGLGDLRMGLSKKGFRKAVLQERARELGYERNRWFDIIRWKMKNIFTETLYGMNICKKGTEAALQGDCKDQGYGYHESQQYIYARKVLKPIRHWKNNFSPKWYLGAFPKNEVNKGYGLVQNPGWEE